MGSIAYVDSLALFAQLPAQLTLISISTEFVLRHACYALKCMHMTVCGQHWRVRHVAPRNILCVSCWRSHARQHLRHPAATRR